MKTKKNDLNINPELPLNFDLTTGSIVLVYDDKNISETSFPDAGMIEPEIKITVVNEKNNVIASNIIDDETVITLHLPRNIKETVISSNSGKISVQGSASILNLTVFDGDIMVVESSGFLKIESFRGFINIDGFTGGLDINSANGPVRIRKWNDAKGKVDTVTGQIVAGINSFAGDVNLHSKNSKISLGLSVSCSALINAKGSDVISYLDNTAGTHTGFISTIKVKDGKYSVGLNSDIEKISISSLKDLENISPDMEDVFKELDTEFSKVFQNLARDSKIAGDKIGVFGKNLTKNISEIFGKKENKSDGNDSMKMEILQMLKDGKITAEEAEKLLKAL